MDEARLLSLVAFPLTPKYVTLNDFEWLEWPFYVIYSLQVYNELPLTHYLLLIHCRLFITRDVTSGQVREAEYSKQWSAERQNIWNPRKVCGSILRERYIVGTLTNNANIII